MNVVAFGLLVWSLHHRQQISEGKQTTDFAFVAHGRIRGVMFVHSSSSIQVIMQKHRDSLWFMQRRRGYTFAGGEASLVANMSHENIREARNCIKMEREG